MALSFTEKVRERLGRKRYHVYEVTHDGSATTVNASDVGLNYIDYAIATSNTALSGTADVPRLSVTAGTFVAFGAATTASTIDVLQLWGT